MRVPGHLRPVLVRMRVDFDHVTGYWLERGDVTADEVEQMRRDVAQDIGSDVSPCAELDPRPREARVLAWADTWRALAAVCPWPVGLAHPGGVVLRDMVVELRAAVSR